MDISARQKKVEARKKAHRKGIWCGPVQKKILLLLFGGFALSCTRSVQKQWRIVKGIGEGLKDISRQAAERAVEALYESKLVEAKQNSDGTVTLLLNDDGKKRALTYHIRYARVKPSGPWDEKWRIILYDIPEHMRESRDAFRDHLKELGVRKLQQSAGICPLNCKNEIDFFVELLDIRKYVRFIVADSIDDEIYWKRKFNLDQYI